MAKSSLYSAYRSAGASVGKYQKGLYAQQGFEAQKTSSAIMSKKKLEKIESTTAAATEAVGMISDWREEKIAKREHKEMMSMFGEGDSSGGAETSGGDAGTIEKAGEEPTFWEEVKQKMTDDKGLFQGGKEGKLFGRASDWFFETGDQQSLYQQAGLDAPAPPPPAAKKDVPPPPPAAKKDVPSDIYSYLQQEVSSYKQKDWKPEFGEEDKYAVWNPYFQQMAEESGWTGKAWKKDTEKDEYGNPLITGAAAP